MLLMLARVELGRVGAERMESVKVRVESLVHLHGVAFNGSRLATPHGGLQLAAPFNYRPVLILDTTTTV